MRSTCLFLVLTFSVLASGQSQTQAPPQTARQALLEMFLGKASGAFEKHLPEAARNALLRGTDAANSPILREFSSFRTGLGAKGGHLLTFDSGPVLLSLEEDSARHKLEIMVEGDDLRGDADEIELSFRSYKEGVLEPLPVVPRLTFSMKQEKEVWKLDEITLALRVPLGDAEFLKGLQKTQNPAFESSAVANLRTLNTAEISYAASYPERGYTCRLSELGGSATGSEPSPEHAMFVDNTLASGKKSGYVFSIRGCGVRPASKYQATAVPADPESGMRAFCSDESTVLRYAADGKAATCVNEGLPLQ